MCVCIYKHICIFIPVYINLDKTNIYNLSVCVSIFICGTLYLPTWDYASNSPEASALTFLSSIQMSPALYQNVLWENWRWW